MRIAVFVKTFPPRHESFILNQIRGVLARGHDVRIVALRRGPKDSLLSGSELDALMARTSYRPEVRRSVWRRGLEAIGSLKQVLQKRTGAFCRSGPVGASHKRFPSRFSASQLEHDGAPFRKLPTCDVVHCQYGPLGTIAVRLRDAGLFDAPIVTSFRGYDLSRVPRESPGAYAELFERGDLFLPVCDAFRQRLIELGCPGDRIVVHRSGIDCSRFDYRARSLPAGEPIRLLTIARLVEKKGIEFAIRAVAKLASEKGTGTFCRNGPQGASHKRCLSAYHFSYAIVGDGPLLSRLKQLAEQLGVHNIVTFRGWLPPDGVRRELDRAHILICPSITASDGSQEGIPNTLKEAMACGLPVVATRHSGIPELVQHGVSGYLVAERDPDAIARALINLIARSAEWTEMGRAGRQRILDQYDIHRLNDELMQVYEAVQREFKRDGQRCYSHA